MAADLAPLTKPDLRRKAKALRDALPMHGADALAENLAAYLSQNLPPVIGGYWPIGSEIDPRPAMARLRAMGAMLALPETTEPGTPLRFRAWQDAAALLPGRFGTRHPDGTEIVPDLLLVPVLAFDRSLHRLGYGGGYYDRTLAVWPHIPVIGCAYAAQEWPKLPHDLHDRKLNAVATEAGMIYARDGQEAQPLGLPLNLT